MRHTPKGIGENGAKLWRGVASAYQLRVDEYQILEDACREVDLIARLEAELEGAPLMVEGIKGQPIASPLVSELRQHRSVLARLLGALKLPDAAGEVQADTRSQAARDLVSARWGKKTA